MPKFTFECQSCQVQFHRNLKQGNHTDHPCPSCSGSAPRLYEGFGFGFNQAPTASPGNTGVTKDDYPTADRAVGVSADVRWQEIAARDKVKSQVRDVGGNRALIRRQGVEEGKPFVEYEAGTKTLIDGRKELVKAINKRRDGQ
jgi:hypothetical protein